MPGDRGDGARYADLLPRALAGVLVIAALGGLPAPRARAEAISKNVQLLAHFDNFARYSACWSYVHHDGREYAVLGTDTGTSIVNVTNPSAAYEVAFIPGLTSIWREMKQYRTWMYVSTEAPGGGVQIIRMTDPENPVLAATYIGAFNRAHTLAIDTTRALLIANGTRFNNTNTGMRVLSLADPESPADLGSVYLNDYVHDSWMRGTRLHAFCVFSGTVRIFDTTEPTFLDEQASWTYPGAKSHSGETSSDGRYLFVCDEINYSTLKVFDIQDVQAHPLVFETTVNPLAIVHNVHVKADTAFVAWYTEGVRLFDVADPTLPAEWAWYDTYPGYSGGFHGVWEVAPLFPSGTFIASDIESGLYVFRATASYGIAKVQVQDPAGQPIAGAGVAHVGFPDDSTWTQPSGAARIALPPQFNVIRVSKFGYASKDLSFTTAAGSRDSFLVTLTPRPTTTFSGVARRSGDAAPLQHASVSLENTPLSGASGPDGAYAIANTPEGIHHALCYRPGYAPAERWTAVEPGVPRSVDWSLLPAAWYDSSDADRGWSLGDPDDNAVLAGRWTREIPNGTNGLNAGAFRGDGAAGWAAPGAWLDADVRDGARGAAQHPEPEEGMVGSGPIAPSVDATPGGVAGYCFVTGNGPPGSDPGAYDIDGGKTTLTSPPLDLSGMDEPRLSWQRWFHMNTPGEPDSFVIQITSDGVSWTTVLSTIESHAHWHRDEIRVADYVTPSATVRVRFIAQDQLPEGTVEAGVDDFQAWDAALTPVGVDATPAEPLTAPPIVLEAPRPNPTAGEASIVLRVGSAGRVAVRVYDVAGRVVTTLFDGTASAGDLTLRWDGRDSRGDVAVSGVYWLRAESAGISTSRRLIRLR